jgi:hypothetical protein
MREITCYARHNDLSVAAGFETEEQRDSYIRLSISNNHPWRICDEEEARTCEVYQNMWKDK